VVLADPKEGKFEWISFSNKKRNDSRAAFLLERYDLSPRNNLAQNHPMHAGWKGMLADDGTRKESIVNWLREDAGILFGILHSEYIRTVRAHLPDGHPYYFVNEKPGVHYGQPLKLSNAAKAFNRAAIRVGLSTTLPGVNPHGARHFFGFYCASVLRLPIETTQRLMHHQSLQSTEIYYALTNETVRNELISAQKRQLLETPALLATPTHFCKLLGNRQ
jgi:integrase